MLYVILNWAKQMITVTCAYKTECTCKIIGTDGNTTDLLVCSFGSDDVPPYLLHSEAPSQLFLCGHTAFIPLNFPFLSSSSLLQLWCTASCTHSSYIPIIKCTTGLFVLALKWCFALVELFLFSPSQPLISATPGIHSQHSYSGFSLSLTVLVLVSQPTVI